MQTIVLLKQTFDTEEKVVIEHGNVVEDGAAFIMNPYDEYAVEEAIKLREQFGGKVTVLCLGPERSAEAVRTALAMGADEAVLIVDERIGADEYAVSQVLAAAIAERTYDLILAGHFSVDNGAGQVALRTASLLQLPHVAAATELRISSDASSATVLRDAEGDQETFEVKLPALITAQQGLNEPRYPSLPSIMKAKKKPLTRLTLEDLGFVEPPVCKTERTDIRLPSARASGLRIVGTPSEQAEQLLQLLQTKSGIPLKGGVPS